MSFQTAQEQLTALRAGEVTSVELTDEAIARIEREDGVINAICVRDFDRARAAAREADRARARGEDLPLLGVPVTVKEWYNIAGLPTTWGVPQHRDHVPAEDAVQVSRVRAAGAVVLGNGVRGPHTVAPGRTPRTGMAGLGDVVQRGTLVLAEFFGSTLVLPAVDTYRADVLIGSRP